MFGTVLISVVTLMHVYVFWRAGSVPVLQRRLPRKALIVAGLVLWSAFLSGRILGHEGTGSLARALELIGMTWMGALFLIFVSLLAVDLITGLGLLLPRLAPPMRVLALILGGVLSAVALVQGLRPPVIQNYEVYLPGLPNEMDNIVLVAISDLHLGSLLDEEWLSARIHQIQAQQPDLVVVLGDLFEGHGQPKAELLPILRRLSAPLGVWVVPGNHEYHGSHNMSSSLIGEAGFHLLRNRWVEVRPGLILAGIDDLTAISRSGQRGVDLSEVLSGRPQGATVLLSHTPWQAEKAAENGVSLMLSGHTHGGQIWPFGYLVKYVYPLLEGEYDVDGMTVIVCRGTGTWGPRMRLWSRSQILRVNLFQKKQQSSF